VSWEPEGREEEIGWNERKDSLKRLLASQRQRAAEEGFPAGQIALGNSVYNPKQPLTSRVQPTRLDQDSPKLLAKTSRRGVHAQFELLRRPALAVPTAGEMGPLTSRFLPEDPLPL
jgi:hypothetical protein